MLNSLEILEKVSCTIIEIYYYFVKWDAIVTADILNKESNKNNQIFGIRDTMFEYAKDQAIWVLLDITLIDPFNTKLLRGQETPHFNQELLFVVSELIVLSSRLLKSLISGSLSASFIA